MAYETKNILVGAAAVYVSQDDSTSVDWFNIDGTLGPDAPTGTTDEPLTHAQWGAAGFDHAGFTNEGIEVSYEPDYGEVEVDQLLDAAVLFKQSMRVSVNTTLTEATLENLLFVWGQSAGTLVGDELGIAGGGLGDEPVERSIGFVGRAPRSTSNTRRERVYQVHRALQVESSAHALRRNEATTLPASFRCLPDPARSGSEYGFVRDRSIEAAS